jgi:hypothetical protein
MGKVEQELVGLGGALLVLFYWGGGGLFLFFHGWDSWLQKVALLLDGRLDIRKTSGWRVITIDCGVDF